MLMPSENRFDINSTKSIQNPVVHVYPQAHQTYFNLDPHQDFYQENLASDNGSSLANTSNIPNLIRKLNEVYELPPYIRAPPATGSWPPLAPCGRRRFRPNLPLSVRPQASRCRITSLYPTPSRHTNPWIGLNKSSSDSTYAVICFC